MTRVNFINTLVGPAAALRPRRRHERHGAAKAHHRPSAQDAGRSAGLPYRHARRQPPGRDRRAMLSTTLTQGATSGPSIRWLAGRQALRAAAARDALHADVHARIPDEMRHGDELHAAGDDEGWPAGGERWHDYAVGLRACGARRAQRRARGRSTWAQAAQGRTLIVVQMAGGNDGLNTIVPYTEAAYYQARPTLAHPAPMSARPQRAAGDESGARGAASRCGARTSLPWWRASAIPTPASRTSPRWTSGRRWT